MFKSTGLINNDISNLEWTIAQLKNKLIVSYIIHQLIINNLPNIFFFKKNLSS